MKSSRIFVLFFVLILFIGCGATRKTLNANTQASTNITTSSESVLRDDSIRDKYDSRQEQQSFGYSNSESHYLDQSKWSEEVTRRIETILDSLGRPQSIVETETERRSGANDIQLQARQEQLLLQHRLDSISREIDALRTELELYKNREIEESFDVDMNADETSGEAAMDSYQIFWKNIAVYIGNLILVIGLIWCVKKYFNPFS